MSARGDGQLTHDLYPDDKQPQDACGVFGVWAAGRRGRQAHLLRALRPAAPRPGVRRHRGQRRPSHPRLQGHGPGLAGLRRGHARAACTGHIAIGHTRYSTTGASTGRTPSRRSAPPAPAPASRSGHNGNLTNTAELAAEARARCGERRRRRDPTAHDRHRPADRPCWPPPRISRSKRPRSRCCPSCAAPSRSSSWTSTTLYAARDPQGIRPLVLGRLERGWVVAVARPPRWTSSARASSARSSPASSSRSTSDGLRSQRFAEAEPKGCLFEYVYLARPDTTIAGRSVHASPGRGRPPAGARAPGRGRPGHPGARVRHPGRDRLRRGVRHPLRPGLVKNAYVGRTFIQPSPDDPPARHPAQAQPAARRHRAASGWSWSTTPSSAATPSAPWSGCCARPAPPRSTCASPARR